MTFLPEVMQMSSRLSFTTNRKPKRNDMFDKVTQNRTNGIFLAITHLFHQTVVLLIKNSDLT